MVKDEKAERDRIEREVPPFKGTEKLLEVKNLSVNFKMGSKQFRAVDGVSFAQ